MRSPHPTDSRPALRRLETALVALEATLDCGMRYGGPLYVAVAVVLILAVGCVFFVSVLPLVRLSCRCL